MSKDVNLIDRGRGLQLSTSRITVHELVPYFQEHCSYEEIMRWLPSLSRDEIELVERYYLEHKQELDEYELSVRTDRDQQIQAQRDRYAEGQATSEKRLAQLEQLLKKRRRENIGEGAHR